MLFLGVVTRITYLRYNSLCYLVPRSREKKELACNLKIFFNFPCTMVVASLAQWLEHWSRKPEVRSSIL